MTITTTYQLTTVISEFTGNTFTDGTEFGPTVVSNGGNGFLLSYGFDNPAGLGPLVDFYDDGTSTPSDGSQTPYGVPSADVDMIGDPAMIRLSNGTYAVIWDSATQGGGDVRGAILDSAGTILHTDFEVSSFAIDTDPEAAALNGGNWVVAMTSGSSIYLQVMSQTGGQVGGQAFLDSNGGIDVDPVICALDDGGFAVSWTVDNGATDEVWYAVRNANGTDRLVPTILGQFGNNDQPAMAALQNGGFAVVYRDSGWGTGGLSLHILDAAGADQLGALRVDPPALHTAIESDPDIAVLSNGMILVTWTHPFSGTDGDIYARLFTATGTPVQVGGSDFILITTSRTNDTASSVAALLEGRFVTAWTDSQVEPSGTGGSVSVAVNEIGETIASDGASDTITGSAFRSTIFGNGGNDTLAGGDGQDTIFGGDGNDTIVSDGDEGRYEGGAGTDRMTSGDGDETMIGGTGTDIIDHSWFNDTYDFDMATGTTNYSDESFTEFEIALMGGGSDSVSGNTGNETIFGGAGNDRLFGLGGNDRLDGGTGNDTLDGGLGNDVYFVDSAADVIQNEIGFSLGGGIDTVNSTISFTLTTNLEVLRLLGTDDINGFGNAAPESLVGNSGANVLGGGGGNDRINGKSGSDTITGGSGSDTLIGEAGDDAFVYLAATESGVGATARDFINGFVHGQDRIVLSAIDANTLTGATNEAFSFIGNATFAGTGAASAGQLRFFTFGGGNFCIVEADRDGNGAADMQIFVNLTNVMTGSDFVL